MTDAPNEDQVLREYLLGRLAPDSRTRVEDRLFSDDRLFWEHVCLVEDELISDFARGALTLEDRADFQQRFACTEERRSKVEFARALQAYVDGHQERQASAWTWLRRPLTAPHWAVAAAALALVVATGAIMQRVGPSSGGASTVAVALSSGLTRGAGELTRVRITQDTGLVRFQIDPGPEPYAAYRVTMHDVGGNEIWSQSNLTSVSVEGGTALVIVLPAELLTDGDYFARVDGLPPGTDPVQLRRYDFRVLRD